MSKAHCVRAGGFTLAACCHPHKHTVQANAQKGDSGHLEVMQAYEYVLGRLGHDSDAAPIWKEFIDFLAGFPPTSSAFRLLFSPEPGKEASKRALRLRDVYQKALQVRKAWCHWQPLCTRAVRMRTAWMHAHTATQPGPLQGASAQRCGL